MEFGRKNEGVILDLLMQFEKESLQMHIFDSDLVLRMQLRIIKG